MRIGRREFVWGAAVSVLAPGVGRAQVVPRGDDGFFALEARAAHIRLKGDAGREVAALTFNGTAPGPLLRLRKGEEMKLRLKNTLARPIAIGFPGMRGVGVPCGFPSISGSVVAPGASAEVRFTPLDCGFGLYGIFDDAESVSSGLMGPLVVDEPTPPVVDLEAIVVFAVWRLAEDGTILRDFADPKVLRAIARPGDLIAGDDGTLPRRFEARPGGRVRLRLVNGSMTRAMTFGVSGARVYFAAIDGQPCELFEPLHNLVPLAPGARVELMFDLPSTNPEDVVFSLKGGEWSPLAGESDRTALIFAAKGEPVTARPPIEALPENKALPKEIALERAKRVDVPLGGGGGSPFTIAGTSNIAWPAKPLFTVARGTPVTLAFSNKTQTAQTMHLGGHVGRLLHALDDGWEPYWRDVVSPAPGKTALLAFIPDAPGKWPLASASPEHRAFGLRAWFQVI